MMEGLKCRELTKQSLADLLNNVDAIFFDCDGVLYRGNSVVEGTPEAVKKLTEVGKKIFYVTNNSTGRRKHFESKFSSMGFPASEEDIISSSYVASCYLNDLKQSKKIGKIFCVGSQELVEELESVGLSVIKSGPSPGENSLLQKAVDYNPDPEVGCVVVGLDRDLTYYKMAQAMRYLSHPGCLFVATNLDASFPMPGNILLPGAGSCIAAIATAAGRKPDVVCGKPDSVMFDIARKHFGIDPARTLMVGDRLDTDIAFANACGMKSLLVLTGVSTLKDASEAEELLQPQYYLNSLADVCSLLSS